MTRDSLFYSFTLSLTHSLTHPPTHPLTHSRLPSDDRILEAAMIAVANLCNNETNQTHVGAGEAIKLAVHLCKHSPHPHVLRAAANCVTSLSFKSFINKTRYGTGVTNLYKLIQTYSRWQARAHKSNCHPTVAQPYLYTFSCLQTRRAGRDPRAAAPDRKARLWQFRQIGAVCVGGGGGVPRPRLAAFTRRQPVHHA